MTLSTSKKCPECGKAFRPKARADQDYCTRKCRRGAEYKRGKSKAELPIGATKPSLKPGATELNVLDRAQNAVVELTHGLKRLAEELGLADAVQKVDKAMDTFTDAFDLMDEAFEITEPTLRERQATT